MGRMKELLQKREEAYANGEIDEVKKLDEIIDNINSISSNAELTKDDIIFRKNIHARNLKRFMRKNVEEGGNSEKEV